jgi:hypothetical protein
VREWTLSVSEIVHLSVPAAAHNVHQLAARILAFEPRGSPSAEADPLEVDPR